MEIVSDLFISGFPRSGTAFRTAAELDQIVLVRFPVVIGPQRAVKIHDRLGDAWCPSDQFMHFLPADGGCQKLGVGENFLKILHHPVEVVLFEGRQIDAKDPVNR